MTERLRAAMQAALEALTVKVYSPTAAIDMAVPILRAALADAEDEVWEVDYEVRVDTGYEEMWVAGASSLKDALHYAPQYTDEGTVRVYERRMKVIATMEARHD